MKEKRILAMFITSAITLVASLAITFGVFMTLADPVVATGVTRYDFSFNSENNSLVSVNGNTLKLSEDIIFQPSSSIEWSTDPESQPVWFNGATYQDEIVYADESVSTRLKVIPFRVTNYYDTNIQLEIKLTYNNQSILGKYMKVMVYDYQENQYESKSSFTIDLASKTKRNYAIIVFADDSSNFGRYTVDWGKDYEKINVELKNTTIF